MTLNLSPFSPLAKDEDEDEDGEDDEDGATELAAVELKSEPPTKRRKSFTRS